MTMNLPQPTLSSTLSRDDRPVWKIDALACAEGDVFTLTFEDAASVGVKESGSRSTVDSLWMTWSHRSWSFGATLRLVWST